MIQPTEAMVARSLRDSFLRSARRFPDRTALVVADSALSYSKCEHLARQWAGALIDRLGRPPRRVGVFASRSETAYIGTLAALIAGACFVPLNRRFPVERTSAMARLADLDAIIVDRASAAQLEDVLSGLPHRPLILYPDGAASEHVDGIDGDRLSEQAPLVELPPVAGGDLAYLLFTSGTTGTPKGVGVTHGNVLHFLTVMSERYCYTEADRVSQTFDQTFDLSVFDLFMAWSAGAAVYVLQPLDLLAPARFINRHELTVWFSVPSLAALMRKMNSLRPGSLPSLRWSLFCGEPLPRKTAEYWQAAAPGSTLENLYGPTELTIACLVYRWDVDASPEECENDIVPIGYPLPGLETLVRSANGEASADGVGELLVCGPQTVPGYWRDRSRTERVFVDVRVEGDAPRRFYATGDRVRRSPEGLFTFLGRTDHQIKVSGYRVELGEIEAVMLRQPEIVSAVALGWPLSDGVAQGIVAFVTVTAPIDAVEFRSRLRVTLPDYMVPSAVHVRESFPLNANGKIDRAALVASLSEG